ncbi:MAG: aminotransferase class I/II-fold pyridoxal phosphate-dependent enzyme [Rickettsiales bacterium]
MQHRSFHRISRLPPYVFAEVNRLKAEGRARGEDVIDFGMGNPDMPPPQEVIEKMCETAKRPDVHGYSSSRGIPGLRKAVVDYYMRRFGVPLDPNKEAIVTIGSKEGLASLATAIAEPGDVFLVPDPGYPIHMYGFIIEGASVYSVKNVPYETVLAQNIKEALEQCSPKPVAIVLNFPNNPTSETVSLEFYREMVEICTHYGVYIISDLAYSEIYFDPSDPPPSILQVEGAKDVAIEFNSVSKTFSMAGWRIGFAVGCPHLVESLAKIKSYIDYGTFTPLQVAATTALNGPESWAEERRALYKSRRDVLIDGFNRAGWEIEPPRASMFAWAKIPYGIEGDDSLAFSKKLLTEASVAVAPGVGFGKHGEGYVRIGLVENEQRIRQACRNIKKFLDPYKARYDGAAA